MQSDRPTTWSCRIVLTNIPAPDIAISMGCNVTCPFIGRTFDDNWERIHPTRKLDKEFKIVIKEIKSRILHLKEDLK